MAINEDDALTVEKPFILPASALLHLKEFGKADVELTVGKKYAVFFGEGISLYCRVLEPSDSMVIENVLPKSFSACYQINRKQYLDQVKYLCECVRDATRNRGQNGHALYSLIYFSNPARLGFEEPAQFSALNQEKKTLYGMVKDLTGLDVRTLARQDATFLTPDGQDLWEIMLEKAKDYKNDDGSTGVSLSEFKDLYQQYARTGWGSDESLSIEYRDGHLYDIGTKCGYGPGQTDWQADLLLNYAEIAQRNMARIAETATPLNVQGREDV